MGVPSEANVVGGGTGSTATGTASFSVVGQTLLFSIDIAGITDVTASHIHGPAAVGVNGGVIQGLCNSDDGPMCKTGAVDGILVAGAAPRSRIPFDSLVVLMRNGNAYVNVHTMAFPGGEIRGQITPWYTPAVGLLTRGHELGAGLSDAFSQLPLPPPLSNLSSILPLAEM